MEEETSKAKKRSSSSVLGSLREAIAKVRFLLSFSATRWMLLRSLARGGAPARRLSFDSRPGLLDVEDSIASPASSSSRTSRSASLGTATTRSLSRTSTSSAAASPEALKRASSASSSGGGSPVAGDDDIDQRAELFIANFYRQLRMERQVSLQLRYVRGNSWDRSPAASPSPSPSRGR
ncbi:uncharacterized protein [Miscanthus floridulus]|uniref:uncharacterized protein n=1 Tax=Miscanthus floridulus TaxID=154761 RepID=UPI003457EB6E